MHLVAAPQGHAAVEPQHAGDARLAEEGDLGNSCVDDRMRRRRSTAMNSFAGVSQRRRH